MNRGVGCPRPCLLADDFILVDQLGLNKNQTPGTRPLNEQPIYPVRRGRKGYMQQGLRLASLGLKLAVITSMEDE